MRSQSACDAPVRGMVRIRILVSGARMAQTFSYKPALLRSAQTITVSDAGVRLEKPGESERAAWGEIATVRYSVMKTHLAEIHGLEFVLEDGRRLSVNRTDADERFEDTDDKPYREMLVAVLEGLASQRPDLDLILGEKRTTQWALFIIGMICIAFAFGITLLALTHGRSSRLEAAVVPIGAMLVFGGYIAWSFHPFGPPTLLKPKQIIDKIKALNQSP